MAYILQAFIGEQTDLQIIADKYSNAQIVNVGQNVSIVPMTEDLFDEINEMTISEDISSFMFLTTNIEQAILRIIGTKLIGYIEAEYFGGQGGQAAIIWKEGHRFALFDYGPNSINSVLKYFEVMTEKGKDEFDTINLGRHRDTNDWLTS